METLDLSNITTIKDLSESINEAIAELLNNVDLFDCIESVTRISAPLLSMRNIIAENNAK